MLGTAERVELSRSVGAQKTMMEWQRVPATYAARLTVLLEYDCNYALALSLEYLLGFDFMRIHS